MKPEQFIREFGIGRAREALTLCCWMDGSFCTRLWHGCVQNNHECCVDVNDLKRLVDSVDLVELLGGIDIAKRKVKMAEFNGFLLISVPVENGFGDIYAQKVERAIRDHESIYGGGDE